MKVSVCRVVASARPRSTQAVNRVNLSRPSSKSVVTARPSLRLVAPARKPVFSQSTTSRASVAKPSRLYINTRTFAGIDSKEAADHIAGGSESKAKPPKGDWEAKKNDGADTAPINSTRKESQSRSGGATREDPTKPPQHGGPSQENSIPVTGNQSSSQHTPDTLDKGKKTINKSISIGGGKIDSDLGGGGGGGMGGVGGKGETPGGIDGGKIDPFPGSHRPKDTGLERGGTRGSGKSSSKDAPVASGVVRFSPFNFLRTSASAPPFSNSLSFIPGFTHHIARALGYNMLLTRSPPRTPHDSPSSPSNRPSGPGHTSPDTSSYSNSGPDKSSQSGSRPEWSETTKNRPEVAPNPPYAS